MRILSVTNMWPTVANPRAGTFVKGQVEGLKSIGVDVEAVVIDRVSNGASAYLGAAELVKRRLLSFHADVLHIMYGGVMSELISRRTWNLPIVQSFCGTDLLSIQSGSAIQRLRGCVGAFCSKRAAWRADQIVVKSENLAHALPRNIVRSKVWVIPNGVDLQHFRAMNRQECKKRLGWPDETFNILFSTPNIEDANKRVPLAKASVEALNHMGGRAALRIMTHTPHSEVPVWLNAADVLLLTSQHEGSPNIVKEALACNRPVVSVDVGDVKARVSGVNGCYIAEPSPQSLADKLMAVAEGAREVKGREEIEDLSLTAVAQRLLRVYERAVEMRSTGKPKKFSK